MGQKRTHNIIDKQIGDYLANFEKDLTDRIRAGIIEPMDGMSERIDRMAESANKTEQSANRVRGEIRHFKYKIGAYFLGAAIIGGFCGALLFYLCLIWL